MKIIGLSIDGIRKLTAIEMEFADKGLIQIRGKNRQGKTSIIDSLEILLRGNKYIETDMITHGKDRAEIVGRIGEYEIKRIITEKTNRLEIRNKDGFELKGKPQAFLDKLINALTFNPRPFLDKSPGEKLKFMMDLMKLDFGELNKKIDIQETERLIVGREIKKIGDLTPVEKAERIVVNDLLNKRTEITELNDELKKEHQDSREQEIQSIFEHNAEQTSRQEKIETEQSEIKDMRNQHKTLQDAIELKVKALLELSRPEPLKDVDELDLPEPELESTENIDIQLTEANETNVKADQYEKYLEKEKEKGAKEQHYEALSTKINALRNLKKSKLKAVKTPVEGLEIREEGIFYNGVFSENWGEEESLRISSELCIGMDPKLRAVFLDKGEAYDVEQLNAYRKWAIKNDLQAIITIVDSTNGTSEGDVYYLEEGQIV